MPFPISFHLHYFFRISYWVFDVGKKKDQFLKLGQITMETDPALLSISVIDGTETTEAGWVKETATLSAIHHCGEGLRGCAKFWVERWLGLFFLSYLIIDCLTRKEFPGQYTTPEICMRIQGSLKELVVMNSLISKVFITFCFRD